MKVSGKELQKIADLYNLGVIRKTSLMNNGLVNYNFLVHTEKGKFTIRVLGERKDGNYINHKATEIKVLEYLHQKKFLYNTPVLLKNNLGEKITLFKNSAVFVYTFIEGQQVKKLNDTKIKEIAKGLALYHKYIVKIPIKTDKKGISDLSWVAKEYELMGQVKPKNRLDKLMKQHFNLFNNLLKKNLILVYKEKPILIHGDFQYGNLLFSKDKLVAILDFDNVDWSWKVKDIAICVKRVCLTKGHLEQRKIDLFTKEYGKYYKLSNEDIKMIKPFILHNYLIVFWWAYKGGMKDEKIRYKVFDRVITEMKNLLKVME